VFELGRFHETLRVGSDFCRLATLGSPLKLGSYSSASEGAQVSAPGFLFSFFTLHFQLMYRGQPRRSA